MLKTGMARGTTMPMDTYIDFPVKDEEDFEEMKKLSRYARAFSIKLARDR